MHKSRLSTFVIDCEGEIGPATDFWSQALGRSAKADPDDANYAELKSDADEQILLVQKVSHPGRIHLDIESDNLLAEVERLEKLGARRIEFRKRWWIMEAPTGQRFCIVNPQRGPLGNDANTWP